MKHRHEWKITNPTAGDFVGSLISSLKTDARWNKAIQHLREDGKLLDAPQDIPNLIKEVQGDILKEESEWIKEMLFVHFIGQINRGVIAGLPEWYKENLAATQFTA